MREAAIVIFLALQRITLWKVQSTYGTTDHDLRQTRRASVLPFGLDGYVLAIIRAIFTP
jgi:hypothetical protein